MTKTLDQTTEEILDLTALHFKVPREQLSPEDDLYSKLETLVGEDMDSLEMQKLLSHLELHFGIQLPDYEVQGVTDFRTLASRIKARL